jgi:dTMP kinase
MFITFEGAEGAGKTTQIRLLDTFLRELGYTVINTREPGGTPIGTAIREILLSDKHRDMVNRAELLLFNAARAQIVDTVIKPALAAKQIVLCDRYADSTLAYQGYGHGMSLDELRQIIQYATAGLKPDLTILLDVDPKAGLRRKQQQGEVNRFEEQVLTFHENVRRGFLTLAQEETARWFVIDATLPIAEIASLIQIAFLAKSASFTIDK